MAKLEKLMTKKLALEKQMNKIEETQNDLENESDALQNKIGDLDDDYETLSDRLDKIDDEIQTIERMALNEPVEAAVKIVKKAMPKLSKELDESVLTLLTWALHRVDMKI